MPKLVATGFLPLSAPFCEECGASIPPRERGPLPTFCSNHCRNLRHLDRNQLITVGLASLLLRTSRGAIYHAIRSGEISTHQILTTGRRVLAIYVGSLILWGLKRRVSALSCPTLEAEALRLEMEEEVFSYLREITPNRAVSTRHAGDA